MMLRLPRSASRLLPSMTLACALAAAPAFYAPAWGADAPAGDAAPAIPPAAVPAAPAPAPADLPAPLAVPAPSTISPEEQHLRNDVDAYFHYAWTGPYDVAAQFAQKIVDEAADPSALIPVLQDIAKLHDHDHNMGYMAQLLMFDNQPDMKDATDKLLLKVQAGNVARAQDPALIESTIRDMSVNERAYENHLPILRRSGELAVPVMIQFLRLDDDQHKPFRGTVRRALVDLGKSALNPLLAATEMSDKNTLLPVIDALGTLGYDVSAPYLSALANNPGSPEEVKLAANSALGQLSAAPAQTANPAGLFLDLALRFYYGKTDIGQTIDNPGATPATPVQTCDYWKWDSDKGLVRTQVPAVIFNDLMTLRACERALTLKADMADAVSLWLDANNRREAEVPAGTTDPVRGDQASAHFYNVSSGARHLDDALARALNDRDAVVALKLTHSLGLIVGSSTLSGRPGDPLTDALRFPDKRVRYEAACALATALPTKAFAGQELVVPLLVHAIGEGGGGNIVVLGASQDEANTAQDTLRKLGYVTAAAASPGEAIVAAGTLPSVDAMVIARGTSDESIARMLALSAQSPQLVGVPEVVMAELSTGFAAAQSITNPLVSVTTEVGGDKLKAAVEAGRQKAGLSPLDQKETDAYAMRAATALGNLAIGDNQILGVAGAETGLLSALNGPRDELVSAVGSVLARLTSATAQQGLARRALDESAPGPVRIALFQSLTVSAKAFGNQLDEAQVKVLEKQAVATKDADIRSAAAEARGALNLPTDQATQLILGQTGN